MLLATMYRHEVLAMSQGIDVDTHNIKWDLVLCLLFAWIFVFFCVIGGVKSVGKVGPNDCRLLCCPRNRMKLKQKKFQNCSETVLF